MQEYIEEQLNELRTCADATLEFNYLIAMERAILQHAALCLLEYFIKEVRDFEALDLDEVKTLLFSPTDYGPIQVLDRLIPLIRSTGWNDCCLGWFEKNPEWNGNSGQEPRIKLLEEWVQFRNDRPGHGVIDLNTISDKIDWLRDVLLATLACLENSLPTFSKAENEYLLVTPNSNITIGSLTRVNSKPIIVRKIKKKGATWGVEYQTLDFNKSESGFYELDDSCAIVSGATTLSKKYTSRKLLIGKSYWSPLALVPRKQTDIFEARENELYELDQWFNDKESRACLVYGDGGVGKTTLVLEFINDILDCPKPDLAYRPDVICFYTAKLTKWTPKGIVYFKGISPVIDEAIRQLASVFYDHLDRKWYASEGEKLIDRVATLFSDAGVDRNNILLILDNTETLARKPGDEKKLGTLITRVSSRLARVMVTSRRRENIEARPIEVLPLDEQEGAKLLDRLAHEYNAKPLIQAGNSRLRKISKDLSGKPLLLDVIARYIAHTGQSIDQAYRKVLQDAGDGLSEFLYEDAWRRIGSEQKGVFMLLSMLNIPVNSTVAGWACSAMRIPHTVWLQAFQETHFGNMTEYGTDYDIILDNLASEFFRVKFQEAKTEDRSAIEKAAKEITKRYKDLNAAENSAISDRVTEAFRTGAARAAKLAVRRGDFAEAREWYEEAIREDSQNAALFDRFAWFLMNHMRDYEQADRYARRARALDKDGEDPPYTVGLISYRMDLLNEGDEFMAEAQKKGKPKNQCLFQMARARVIVAKHENDLKKTTKLLDEAESYARNSLSNISDNDPFKAKNFRECKELLSYIERVRSKKGTLRKGSFTH